MADKNIVVVTGFGPFGIHNVNASWEAVRLVPNLNIERELDIKLVIEELPVLYEEVGKRVPQLWHSYKPLLMVHVGVSHQTQSLTVEARAEKAGYVRRDIAGCTPHEGKCCVGNEKTLHSAFDIKQLGEQANSNNKLVKTTVSNDAGKFLCEYTYYISLSIDRGRTVFVHVPPLGAPYSACELAEGLKTIISLLIEQIHNVALQERLSAAC